MEEYTHCLNAALDELCGEDDERKTCGGKGRMGRRKYEDPHDSQFKSKNLGAERRRREKLSQRMLSLRSLVPVITNVMNKATIIEDSITYISELKKNVKRLQGQLLELDEAANKELDKRGNGILMVEEDETTNNNIIEGGSCVVRMMNEKNKWWMKMIFEKKKGRITKLMEGLNCNGFQLSDTTLTTSHGTVMLSSSLEVVVSDHKMLLDPSTITNILQGILANL